MLRFWVLETIWLNGFSEFTLKRCYAMLQRCVFFFKNLTFHQSFTFKLITSDLPLLWPKFWTWLDFTKELLYASSSFVCDTKKIQVDSYIVPQFAENLLYFNFSVCLCVLSFCWSVFSIWCQSAKLPKTITCSSQKCFWFFWRLSVYSAAKWDEQMLVLCNQ